MTWYGTALSAKLKESQNATNAVRNASANGGGMPELRRDSYIGLGEGLSSKIVEVRVAESRPLYAGSLEAAEGMGREVSYRPAVVQVRLGC